MTVNTVADVQSPASFSQQYKTSLVQTLDTLDLGAVAAAVEILKQARASGKQIFVCGNGGSASTASHFATDLVKGASYNRKERFKILPLTDSLSTITAYSNDVSYDSIFLEQLKNFAQPGDVFMGISGSGNSPNVVKAAQYAHSIDCQTIALTGRDGGSLGKASQVEIRASEQHMGRIEDAHLIICHMLCYYFMDC